MMLIEETTVPDGVLPVGEFKAHLRLGTGFAEDSTQDEVLLSFLRAALSAIEGRTGKILFERSFRWSVTSWRETDAQPMPVAPVQALVGMELVDRQGVRTPVANEAYWLEQDPAMPRIRAVGLALPVLATGMIAEVQFMAGYGLQWTDIPSDLRQAVLLLAAHYYEFRNETALSAGCMPFGVTSLIERYKVLRIYGGGAR